MGMSAVAEWAAWRDPVALARIRSTFSDRKPLMMVGQLAVSPEALPSLKVTPSWPSFSTRASLKPWVAASRAGCWSCWQMPTVYLPPAGSPWEPLVSGGWVFSAPGPAQAARDRAMTAASSSAVSLDSFFILNSSIWVALLLLAVKVTAAKSQARRPTPDSITL